MQAKYQRSAVVGTAERGSKLEGSPRRCQGGGEGEGGADQAFGAEAGVCHQGTYVHAVRGEQSVFVP